MNEKKNLTTKETFDQAVKNHKKNNLDVAENLYKKILEKDPNHFQSICFLGTLSIQIKNFERAKKLLNKAIGIQPNNANVNNNLGIVNNELEDYQKAINYFQKAIKIQPNHANAHNNLGNVFKVLGEHQKAISCYQNAIKINPSNTSIINGLSDLCKLIQLDNITKTNSTSLKELFLFLFRRNNINHTDIFRNAKLLLFIGENDNQVRQIANSDSLLLKNKIIQNLSKEELFLLMLQKSLMTDKFLEKLLTKLRYEILFTLVDSNQNILKRYFDFIVSLAEQCLLNEYVYVQSKKEINHVNQLKNKIVNNKEINELEMAILGCYIPLYTSKNITNKLLDYKSKNILFNDLITMQIKEPLKEIKLVNSIKSFDKIIDSVSKKVREQYEEHPYPRWRYTNKNLPSNFLFKLNNEIKPNKIEYSNKFVNPNVLIAGCGTGKHITIAERYLNANILGVDLSLASLAYAKRKTEELGFKNIEFLHADILQLKNLNRKFDVIECVGTLHHMKDPLTGLKVLLDLLEPHGFLKLGLYSEIARQHIVKAREFIKKKKFKNTIKDIRNCRELIFNEKKDPLLQKIFHSNDFYSTSSVRDLMFHVKEHRFTIPEISKMLKKLNLEFLGFLNLLIKIKFSKFFPNDKKNISLDNWNQFEISNPDTFSNMYQFWVRKLQKI
ncbi:MAG: tetratricopeptide repeat protein [Candidatus Pelagibacter bacterium]|jgi:SAM-dependent methyltransferase/Flp pilus assembly protein TadD|nr:tetratricopeptide repeat protein [Candidatus Pelagibacter bacterium]